MDVKSRSLYYYNAKRIGRRWPHAIFCYMASLFTDNAFILYNELQPGLVQNIRLSGRKEFILKLSEELSKPKMELRTNSVSYMLRMGVGVQPHFCPWEKCVFSHFPHFPRGEKWGKKYMKKREKYSFPSLSIYFFPIFPMGKNGKRHNFPMDKNGVGPPPLRIVMCEKYGVARPQHPRFPEAPSYAVVGNCHICRKRTRSKCLRCKRSACKECGIRQFLCRDRQMCRRS